MIIIDGHNLIGADKDIKLSDPDAKEKLLYKLSKYQKIMDRKLMVVFDGKSYGDFEKLTFNDIEIRYPLENESADALIKKLIDKFRNQHGVCVVSSDSEIKNYAKHAHISFQESSSFANEVNEIIFENLDETEKFLSPVSVDEWLEYFKKNK